MITIWNEWIWHIALHFPVSSHLISFHGLSPPLSSSATPLLFLPYTNSQPDAQPDANSLTSTWGEILNREEEVNQTWERELVKEGNTKGRNWESQSMRDWTDCNISSSKLQQAAIQMEKKSPEPCQFVSEGEKPAVRSNRPLIFLSCIKGNHTLGRICWWTSTSYIHCLSYTLCQCIHTPQWNQSQNTLCRLLFPTAYMDTKPLCFRSIVLSICACQKNYSILFLWQDFSTSAINPQKQQPVAQRIATKAFSVSIYFPFPYSV